MGTLSRFIPEMFAVLGAIGSLIINWLFNC